MDKRILSRLTLGATLLLLVACTSTLEDGAETPSTPQQVTMGFTTRSIGGDDNGNFTTGDKVKVFGAMGGKTESTVFTLGSGGSWQTSESKNYLAMILPATLTAVYPSDDAIRPPHSHCRISPTQPPTKAMPVS